MIIRVFAQDMPYWLFEMMHYLRQAKIGISEHKEGKPVADTFLIAWRYDMVLPDLSYVNKLVLYDEYGEFSPYDKATLEETHDNFVVAAPYVHQRYVDHEIHDIALTPPLWSVDVDPRLPLTESQRPGQLMQLAAPSTIRQRANMKLYSSIMLTPTRKKTHFVPVEFVTASYKKTVVLLREGMYHEWIESLYMMSVRSEISNLAEAVHQFVHQRNKLLLDNRRVLEPIAHPALWIKLLMEPTYVR